MLYDNVEMIASLCQAATHASVAEFIKSRLTGGGVSLNISQTLVGSYTVAYTATAFKN